MNITVKAVKLLPAKRGKDEHLLVNYTETFDDKSHASGPITFDRRPHTDLTNKMANLRPHLAILTDFLTDRKAAEPNEIQEFVVSGYSIGGTEDDPGIVISGHRKGKFGATILNTPFMRFNQPADGYRLIGNLEVLIDEIEAEVVQYVKGEKFLPPTQQELPFKKDKEKDNDKKEEVVTTLQFENPDPDANLTLPPVREPEPNIGGRIPTADPEAQQRVAQGFAEDEGKVRVPKGMGRKKKPQSAENPAGE